MNILIFHSFFKRIILLCLLIVCANNVYSQTENNEFHQQVDSILSKKPKNYSALESAFSSIKQDTIKMSYLVHKSAKSDYKEGECYALNALGTSFRNISLYDDAISMHTRALRISREIENLEMEVYSLNMLGVDYRRMDAIRSALDYHKEALDLAEAETKPTSPHPRESFTTLLGVNTPISSAN